MTSTRGRGSMRSRRIALGGDRHAYWDTSRRPLHILAFLLPLLVAYHLGLAVMSSGSAGGPEVLNLAHIRMLEFFDLFGISPRTGLHLGGFAIVAVLLTWHVILGEGWKVNGRTLLIMAGEAALLTVPLIVLAQIVIGAIGAPMSVTAAPVPTDGGVEASMAELGLLSRLMVSIGAGLYEELVFRMLFIGVLHTLLVDVGKASQQLGGAIAVIISAAAFAGYHEVSSLDRLLFYFLAGVYFGVVFLLRGFGLAVGVHALYNVVMVLWAMAEG